MGQSVRRRRVFYIPGFDPFHPRRYRELYRTEGAEQARISGYDLSLSPNASGDCFGWRVEAGIEGQAVTTDVEVLQWADIVRDGMSGGLIATYAGLARTAWTYISTGALRRLFRLRKGPIIAALYPVVFLLVQLALACGLAVTAAALGQAVGGTIGLMLGGLIGLVAGWALLDWFRRNDNRFYAHYLMQDYAHTAQHRGATPPELAERLSQFTDRVEEALRSDVDEVLIVGHSSGAHLGVSVLANLLRAGGHAKDGPALGFLTLGQVVPMVSFLPEAHGLRADLQYLSESDALSWVDVTAPGDGCAFALCDPVAVSGVATPKTRWPLVFSARFTQSLSPQRWATLKRRYFRLHFQYLCAFDRPLDYDYFQITAGPRTLGQRYADRKASRSRIGTAVSKYTSVAA